MNNDCCKIFRCAQNDRDGCELSSLAMTVILVGKDAHPTAQNDGCGKIFRFAQNDGRGQKLTAKIKNPPCKNGGFVLQINTNNGTCRCKVGFASAHCGSRHATAGDYFSRKTMRPLVKSYGVISTLTLSPVSMRM